MGYYEDALKRAEEAGKTSGQATILRKWKDRRMKVNSRGARSDYVVDAAYGFKTTGLSLAVNEISPGGFMASHRHPGEAIIYIVEGRGYTVIDGERFDWEAGDLVFISHLCWHQHFNLDPERTATYVRFAMGSLLKINTITHDPMPHVEHHDPYDGPDLKSLVWPEPH